MPLPDQLDTNGEWEAVLNRLYDCFRSIFFADPRLLAQDRLLTCDSRCIEDDKVEGFWHIVSRGRTGERTPDFARARCMSWIPAMLDGSAEGLSRWRYVEGDGKTRQYYWLEEENYVLILEEQRLVTVLVTAFFVDKNWQVLDLTKKRQKGAAF